MLNRLLRPVATAALLALAGAAHADMSFFSSADAFLARLKHPATDAYTDLGGSIGQDLATPLTRSAGSFGYGLFAYNSFASDTDTVHITGTADDPSVSTTNNGSILIVDRMTGGANAFGAYIWGADASDAFRAATINFEVLDADGVDKVYSFTPTAADQGSFVGVISTSSLQIVNAWITPTSADIDDLPYVIMDNVTLSVAAAVPEPANYALMLGGLAVLGAAVRRRKA